MSKVAIVGSGFIGRAWAISFARAGHEVALWDGQRTRRRKALDYIAGVLPDLVANDLLNGASADALLARIDAVAELEEALAGAIHVQENTPEDVEVKRDVFARARRGAPSRTRCWRARPRRSCLRPSPKPCQAARAASSSIRSTRPISFRRPRSCRRPGPIPPWSSARRAFMRAAGQAPIVMKREIDGFVMNRLQGALLEEAFRLVADGYAGVEDVDIGIREGLALRWSFMGPFETIDLNAPGGVRDYAERYQQIYAGIFPTTQRRADWAGPVMDTVETERRKRLPADRLQERQAWRDRRLMALRRAQAQADEGYRALSPKTWKGNDMASSNKVIITCAVTGAIHTPSMSPHLPVTAGGDRRGGDRGGGGGRRDRPSARARSDDRQAGPEPRGVRAASCRGSSRPPTPSSI